MHIQLYGVDQSQEPVAEEPYLVYLVPEGGDVVARVALAGDVEVGGALLREHRVELAHRLDVKARKLRNQVQVESTVILFMIKV